MPLTAGTRLGPYEVVAMIGEGGMGEVYLARDSRLKRDVAIKVLPALVANDPERLARFEREAQVLAALSHPNIAAIFGLEHAPPAGHALVMELVEGQTLAELIPGTRHSALGTGRAEHGGRAFRPGDRAGAQAPAYTGPATSGIPLSDALSIARQIADALETAHEKGIIHRDLKPANVKLTPDGQVKVLDFGLAKAMDPAVGATHASPLQDSPTLTARATQMGMILGTAAYMAPEQARGKTVDRRADIWSFGCVLYELLTGRRTFEGEEIADVLARLIERDPDWTALPADTPAAIRRLLERCLTKDPKARLRDIGEARLTIEEVIAGKTPAPAPAEPRPAPVASANWARLLPWGLVAASLIVAGVLYLRAPTAPPAGRPMHVELNLPVDVEFFTSPSLTADGTKLAFVGVRRGIRQVYTRSLGESDVRPIAGTETAVTVTLSPDGSAAAFVTNDTKVKRVTFAASIVEPLAEGATIYSSPAWIGDGAVVFSRGERLVLRLRDGGERELAAVDRAAGEVSLGWPVTTAGSGTVLFVSRRTESSGAHYRLEAVPAAGGARRLVLDGVEQALVASAGRLVFARGGALFEAPFDAAAAEVRGPAVRMGEALIMGSIVGGVAAAVSDSGALVLAPPSVLEGHMVWVSMTGVERPIPGPPRGFLNPRVSPDGRLIAFSEGGTVWTFDPERSTFTRVSPVAEPTVGFPLWSRDGKRLYYRSADGIRLQSADGEGASRLLPNTSSVDYPNALSLDGKTLVLLRLAPATGGDLYTTFAEGGEIKPLLVTNAYEGGAQVSPDGKWLLYVSNESGRMEVLLRPFGGPDRKWSVSNDGGMHPLWSPDGRRIYYRSDQHFMAVDVTTTPDVHLSTAQVLFDKRYAFGQNLTIPNYSISADGRQFLTVQEEPGGRHLNLVLNWLQGLGR